MREKNLIAIWSKNMYSKDSYCKSILIPFCTETCLVKSDYEKLRKVFFALSKLRFLQGGVVHVSVNYFVVQYVTRVFERLSLEVTTKIDNLITRWLLDTGTGCLLVDIYCLIRINDKFGFFFRFFCLLCFCQCQPTPHSKKMINKIRNPTCEKETQNIFKFQNKHERDESRDYYSLDIFFLMSYKNSL